MEVLNNVRREKKQETKEIKINLKTLMLIAMALVIVFVALVYAYFQKTKELDSNPVSNIPKETVIITEFNKEDAVNLLAQYLEERSLAYSNPQALLEKYSFATNQEFSEFEKTSDELFMRTDIIYEQIRKEMQKYITKELFTKQFKNIYKLSNGITHVSVANAPKETYTITRNEQIESSSTKQILNVWYKTTKEGVTSEEKNMQVEYSKVNGNWIISNIK